MPSVFDEVLVAVRARLEARRKAAQDLAETIKRAADAYVVAVEREAVAELSAQVGVPTASDAASPSAKEAADAMRRAIAALPDIAAPRTVVPRTEVARERSRPTASRRDREMDAAPDLPEAAAIREAARRGHVVVLGGVAKRERVEQLKKALGFAPEWIETTRPGMVAVRKLEGRILDGRVAAVVVLDGAMGHAHFEPIARATRQTGIPLVYADKAGKGALDKAVTDLESRFKRKK